MNDEVFDTEMKWIIGSSLLLFFGLITFVGYSILEELDSKRSNRGANSDCTVIYHKHAKPTIICE